MMVKYVVENRCYCFYSFWWSLAKASFSAILQGTSIFKPGTSSSLSAHNLSKPLPQHNTKNHPTPPTYSAHLPLFPPAFNKPLTSSPYTPHKTTPRPAPSSSPRNSNETTHTDTPHYRTPPYSRSSRSDKCSTSSHHPLPRPPPLPPPHSPHRPPCPRPRLRRQTHSHRLCRWR